MNPSQELLQSLPRELAWGAELCLYHGFWFNSVDFERVLFVQNNFEAKDTDILIATTPKAGTTWLKALLLVITNRSQYATDDPHHPLLSNNPHVLVPFLEVSFDNNPNNQSPLTSPGLLSTHCPYTMLPASVKTSRCRIIYLCRDPKEIFISNWHFGNKIMSSRDGSKSIIPIEQAFEMFCRGAITYGPIWDHALEYWNMSLQEPEKVLFLKYNELKADIISQIKKIADFVGFPFSAEEESKGVIQEIAKMCSFVNLSNLDVNTKGFFGTKTMGEDAVLVIKNNDFFRKGEVGDWKNYITPSMREQLDQITEQKLLGSHLKFD